jgi:hypothetical protein
MYNLIAGMIVSLKPANNRSLSAIQDGRPVDILDGQVTSATFSED